MEWRGASGIVPRIRICRYTVLVAMLFETRTIILARWFVGQVGEGNDVRSELKISRMEIIRSNFMHLACFTRVRAWRWHGDVS